MTDIAHVQQALNADFLKRHPEEAAQVLAAQPLAWLLEKFAQLPIQNALSLWEHLPHDAAAAVLQDGPPTLIQALMTHADPVALARALLRLEPVLRERLLKGTDSVRRRELVELASYPEDSAGALMDAHMPVLQRDMTVREALHRLRRRKPASARQLFVVDDRQQLSSSVEIQDLALAEGATPLGQISRPVVAAVLPTAGREEVVELLDRHRLSDLAVVDVQGRLVGVIHYDALMEAVREETSADLLTMVGVSKDERALSSVGFVVRKRLLWLEINLVTAFLAAAVVGLFESTIARFTALAVLLPVVAGQSGNTGAQALAVTMRGLALREIGTSQWRRVAGKEIGAGLINGVAIALTTAIGVWIWSGSAGLAAVIAISMVISMAAAGVAGVIIPVTLSTLGQDPAQSSSIILTTVTDVTGFFTFLGIATVLAGML